MNAALVHSELNFNWRLFCKTVSKSPNWGFDRFRIYGNSWSTRIQVRRPDGTVVDTQYFSSNYGFEHDFSFDLSENVNNAEYEVYIAGVPASATTEQVYAYPTGYGGTTGKNAEISYWDLSQVSPEKNGANIGRLRLENQPLTLIDGAANIKAGEIKLQNCQLGAENLADLIIGVDNSGVLNGTFDYSSNSAAPAGRALGAYNNLKNNEGWTLTGEVPVDSAELPSLIHYYTFDESTGDLIDQLGAMDGINYGSLTRGVTGKKGSAYSYNGSNTYTGLQTLQLSEYSVEFWLFPRNLSGVGFILSNYESADSRPFYIYTSSNRIVANIDTSSNVTYNTSTNNIWYHVVVTAKSNGNLNLYINGVLQHSIAINFQISYNTKPLRVGMRGDDSYCIDATIDEMRIFNKQLTDQEVLDRYNSYAA